MNIKKYIRADKKGIIFIYLMSIIIIGITVYHCFTGMYTDNYTDVPVSSGVFIENVKSDTVITQYFELPKKNVSIKDVDIMFATYSDKINTNGMKFSIYNPDNELLFETNLTSDMFKDNDYLEVELKNVSYHSGEYYYTLTGLDDVASTDAITPAVWLAGKDTGTDTDTDTVTKPVCTRMYCNGQLNEYNINTIFTYSTFNYTVFVIMFICLLLLPFIALLDISVFDEPKTYVKIIIEAVLFVFNLVYIEQLSEIISCPDISLTVWKIFITCIFITVLTILFSGLWGRLIYGIITTDILMIILSFTNYYVIKFRGAPFIPTDLLAVNTLKAVIGEYSLAPKSLQLALVCSSIILFALLIKLSKNNWLSGSINSLGIIKNCIARGLFIIAGIIGIGLFANPSFLGKCGVEAFTWDRLGGATTNGIALNFMVNVQFIKIKKPQGYSVSAATEILDKYSSVYDEAERNKGDGKKKKSSSDKKPNIIMIMNESLSDFENLPDSSIALTDDPLENIHAMTEDTIKGNCYVSIFGSGTSNSEFEALTGHTMAFFPTGCVTYQQFPRSFMPGLARDLKAEGYNCIAMHPENGNNWNRKNIYNAMEFDEFLTIEDFEGAELVRWISDKATYDKIIDLHKKQKKTDTPLFVLDITMQGHGGYQYANKWKEPVSVKGAEFPDAAEFLSSTKVSDKSFKELVNYFKKQDEKTVILMFGDHQPRLDDAFYEALFNCALTDMDSLDMIQKQYITPYILWANYDIKEANEDISSNSLSLLVKETAGIEFTPYNKFLSMFNRTIPLINANGYMDADNVWHLFSEKNEYSDLIQEYRIVQYYMYYDYEG